MPSPAAPGFVGDLHHPIAAPRGIGLRTLAAAACLFALFTGDARADSHEEADAAAKETARLTLPSGSLLVQVPFEVQLSKGAVAKPVSVAPDLWYGVTDILTIGLIHSELGRSGFFTGVDDGVCFVGESRGCAELYDNVGLGARVNVLDGSLLLAVEAGGFADTFAADFGALVASAKIGVTGLARAGTVNVLFGANYVVRVTQRDGDKGTLNVPVTVALGLGSSLSAGVQSGVSAQIADAAGTLTLPLAAGLRYLATPKLSFDASFSFPTFYNRIAKKVVFDDRALVFSTSIAL